MAELRDILANELMEAHGDVNVDRRLSGFDRNNLDTMGQMEYCVTASTGNYWRIESDGSHTAITGETEFSDGTTLADRTLVHFPTSGNSSFSYWYRGELFVKTTTQSIQIDEDKQQYVFYDQNGLLSSLDNIGANAHDLIVDHSLIAYIATYTKQINITIDDTVQYTYEDNSGFDYFADERHGIIMSGESHLTQHATTGFAWHTGMLLTGVNTGNRFHGHIGAGSFFDEDILVEIAESTNIPFIGQVGMYDDPTKWNIFQDTSGDIDTIAYGSTQQMRNTTDGYVSEKHWIMESAIGLVTYTSFWATNNVIHPIVKVISQYGNGTRREVRKRTDSLLFDLKITGLPAPEMQCIATLLVNSVSGGKLMEATDDEVWVDQRRGFPISRYF